VKPFREDPFPSVSYGHYAIVSYCSVNVLNFFRTGCITFGSEFHLLFPHVNCELKENFFKSLHSYFIAVAQFFLPVGLLSYVVNLSDTMCACSAYTMLNHYMCRPEDG
jgi:hypothetical protein